MKHGDDQLALHGSPQRVVVSHLARHQDVDGTVLEDVPAGASTYGGGVNRRCRIKVPRCGHHDMLQAAQAGGEATDQIAHRDWLSKLDLPAITGAFKAGWGRGRGGLDGGTAPGLLRAADDIDEPVIQATRDGVDGGVGTVNSDVLLSQLEQDPLLRVGEIDRLEPSEDEGILAAGCDWSVKRNIGGMSIKVWACGRTVAHNQGSLLVDSLLSDGWAQVVGKEDGLVLWGRLQTEMLLAGSIEVAQEQADVVPSPVGDLFRVPGVGVSARHIRMAGGVAGGDCGSG